MLVRIEATEKVNITMCPQLKLKPNMKPFLCDRESCRMTCKRGSAPIGKQRVSCRKTENEIHWSAGIGECKKCKDKHPKSHDPRGSSQYIPSIKQHKPLSYIKGCASCGLKF